MIELQNIDCNCNDCAHMVRDFEKYKKSLESHNKWQFDYFNVLKNNLIKKSIDWRGKWELEKYEAVSNQADKMKFQFDKNEAMINYGTCSRLKKAVSFIPNHCQLDTQGCFEHRRLAIKPINDKK